MPSTVTLPPVTSKAGDEVEQGGFAAAGRADDGGGLAGLCGKADVLQRIAVRPGKRKLTSWNSTTPCQFSCSCGGLCGSFVRVVDGGRGADDLVDAVRSHTGAGQHDGHHGQHQEGHDDLHGVGDECDHLAHLHGAVVHGLAAEPDDQQAGAVHDEGHKGHHGNHGTVGEQLGAHQVCVGLVEALLLKLFAAEGTHRHDAGQNLAADEVQPVHQLLHDLELGHGHTVIRTEDEQQQNGHGQHDDPGKAGAAVRHADAANAQNGRIGHHAQQHDADELHLLDIVGGAGDERCGGKILDLCVGEPDDAGKVSRRRSRPMAADTREAMKPTAMATATISRVRASIWPPTR